MKSSHKKNNNDKGNCSTHALKIPFTYSTHCEYNLIDIINEDYYNDIHTNSQCIGERSNVYVSIRNKIIAELQSMCITFNYTDRIFYKALLYLDYIFTNKDYHSDYYNNIYNIKLLAISILLLIAKFHGLNTYMCDFNSITLFSSLKQLKLKEIRALKLMRYDFRLMSVYDYLSLMFHNGVVFINENVSDNNVLMLYRYMKYVLAHITQSTLLMKYNPKVIAFVIALHVRYKQFQFKLRKENTLELERIYKCKRSSYMKCYEELIDVVGEWEWKNIFTVKSMRMKVKGSCNVFTKVVKCSVGK
jgi:hypothetical protein